MGLFTKLKKPDDPKYQIMYKLNDHEKIMYVQLGLLDHHWSGEAYYISIQEIEVPIDAPEFEADLVKARDELIEYSEIREIAFEASRTVNGFLDE